MLSQDFANWATGIALLLGVTGAAWKWIFAEWVRRQTDKRHPAIEGAIKAEVIPHDGDKRVIRVSCIWTNHSRLKIYLDVRRSHISLYDIADNFSDGTIDLSDKATKYLYRCEPYAASSYVFYEPETSSEFAASFVVPAGRTYGARAVIEMDEAHMGIRNVIWFRETVVHAP